MPCEMLIMRGALQKPPWRAGHVLAVKDCPCSWGTKETLPNWVRVRITDATADQVKHYLGEWLTGVFKFSIVAQNDEVYRVRIEANDAIVSATGINRAIKANAKEVIQYIAPGSQIVDHGADFAVIDIPKPANLAAMRGELRGILQEQFEARRYYFAGQDIEWVADQGGFAELTSAQVISRIKDRLAE